MSEIWNNNVQSWAKTFKKEVLIIDFPFSDKKSFVGGLTTDNQEYYCGYCNCGIPKVHREMEDQFKSWIHHLEEHIIELMDK